MELELPGAAPCRLSIWDHLTQGAAQIVTRSTARGALYELLNAARPGCIWYPSFFCPQAVISNRQNAPVRFYPITGRLQADAAWLQTRLAVGDSVIAMNFFGVPAGAGLQTLAAQRPDVLWIEDRAQALAAGPPWGDWLTFSPRKLFGVPDGGLAVCCNAEKRLEIAEAAPEADLPRLLERLKPLYWRYEDGTEVRNELWHEAFQTSERKEFVPFEPLSRFSEHLLRTIDVTRAIRARRDNAAMLAQAIAPELRLFPSVPQTPLLGFPVVVEDRDDLARRLAQDGLFCAVHWRGQVATRDAFPDAHLLADHILTLPCDQRYGASDMQRIIDCVGGSARAARPMPA